jgi:microcompartment protein CcmK/EutM
MRVKAIVDLMEEYGERAGVFALSIDETDLGIDIRVITTSGYSYQQMFEDDDTAIEQLEDLMVELMVVRDLDAILEDNKKTIKHHPSINREVIERIIQSLN